MSDEKLTYEDLYGEAPEGDDNAGTAETSTGEEETATDEPAEEAAEETEETTEEAEEDGADGDADGDTEGEPEDEADEDGGEPDREKNARYAAVRRKEQAKARAKAQAEIERIRQEERQRAQETIDAAFAKSGMKNPYTGQLIRSQAEYDEYQQRHAEEAREALRRKTGMSDEEYDAMIASLPEVRKAMETQARAEEKLRQAFEREKQQWIQEQVDKIHARDPSINSIQDIEAADPEGKVAAKVRQGYSLFDAWSTEHLDELTSRGRQQAAAAAVNKARSKDHLVSTRSRGKGDEPVPENVRRLYREINPEASEEEIRRHYNKTLS